MFVIFQFGMLQNAHAASNEVVITKAPSQAELEANQDLNASALGGGKEMVNARHAISPYAQVVPNESYTFIGISHPSLATAHTSIGVVLEVLDMTTVPNTAVGRAAVFTVDAGDTHRVFIVNQNHATINASNDAFTGSNTSIITTANTSQFGNIKITGIHTSPLSRTTGKNRGTDDGSNGCNTKTDRSDSCYTGETNGTPRLKRFDNVSQLAMWGVVYKADNGAGFALEFIGDMHDSSSGGTHGGHNPGGDSTPLCGALATCTVGATAAHGLVGTAMNGKSGSAGMGRGIN